MNGNICFFIGHRNTPWEIFPSLCNAVEKCITEFGVTEFIVGHYGDFDSMAARAVADAKKKHHVRLTLLLPYHPADRYPAVNENFDGTFYPPDMEKVPRKAAIVRANRYAVDMSEYIISYVKYPGNSRKLIEYALGKNKHIIEIK